MDDINLLSSAPPLSPPVSYCGMHCSTDSRSYIEILQMIIQTTIINIASQCGRDAELRSAMFYFLNKKNVYSFFLRENVQEMKILFFQINFIQIHVNTFTKTIQTNTCINTYQYIYILDTHTSTDTKALCKDCILSTALLKGIGYYNMVTVQCSNNGAYSMSTLNICYLNEYFSYTLQLVLEAIIIAKQEKQTPTLEVKAYTKMIH